MYSVAMYSIYSMEIGRVLVSICTVCIVSNMRLAVGRDHFHFTAQSGLVVHEQRTGLVGIAAADVLIALQESIQEACDSLVVDKNCGEGSDVLLEGDEDT